MSQTKCTVAKVGSHGGSGPTVGPRAGPPKQRHTRVRRWRFTNVANEQLIVRAPRANVKPLVVCRLGSLASVFAEGPARAPARRCATNSVLLSIFIRRVWFDLVSLSLFRLFSMI
jgi:hypothetical protein